MVTESHCSMVTIQQLCSNEITVVHMGTCKAVISTFDTMSFILSLQAYKRGMTYPRYAFITYGWYRNHWWVSQGDINCTVQEMEKVLNHSLAVFAYPRIQNSMEVVDAGIVSTSLILYVYCSTMLQGSSVSKQNFNQLPIYCL